MPPTLRTLLPIAVLVLLSTGCRRHVVPSSGAIAPCARPVGTTSGAVSGELDERGGTCVWRGIPYAAPPVGDKRWRAPEPAPQWSGVREAHAWGPRCMQGDNAALNLFNADASGEMSEDCLYLNIWRPRQEGRFPVLVWIHGGGYGFGTPNTPLYWGDRLADSGRVIVVTIAYRLGPLGFLALPGLRDEDPSHSTGGYGTLDQIAALRWVRENIAGFGGDPERVTIFGESAGGWSICSLVASPLARGLFHAAIMESGGCDRAGTLEAGYARGLELARMSGCPDGSPSCLRSVDAARLIQLAPFPRFNGFVWGPHQDGHVLTGTPLAMIEQGTFNRVPFLAGTTRDEVLVAASGYERALHDVAPQDYETVLQTRLGRTADEAAQLAKYYPLDQFENRPFLAYARMATESVFHCPTVVAADALARQGIKVFLYRYDHDRTRFSWRLGAMHGSEIPLVFGNLDRPPTAWMFGPRERPLARQLSAAIRAYWVTFARLGEPDVPWLPEWPRHQAASPRLQVLALDLHSEPVDSRERCAILARRPLELKW